MLPPTVTTATEISETRAAALARAPPVDLQKTLEQSQMGRHEDGNKPNMARTMIHL